MFTFFISLLFSVGTAAAQPVFSLANGSVMHIEYGDQWFGKYKFLEANAETKVCKIVLSKSNSSSLETMATSDRLDLPIQYITYSKTVEAPYRQLVILVFKEGWVDCRFNQVEVVSLDDIGKAFETSTVSFTQAEAKVDVLLLRGFYEHDDSY